MPELEERTLSFSDGKLNTGVLVRGGMSRPGKTEGRVDRRFRAAISDGELPDVLQNGDVK